jgi:hypothetical protein
MLKRTGHIILSLVLLVSTMGMAVSKHYCKGSLESVAVFHEAKSCCDMDNCCHDETQVYQVKEDFSVPAVSSIPVLAELDILGHDLLAVGLLNAPETEDANLNFIEAPPLLPIQKTLALKEVFLL